MNVRAGWPAVLLVATVLAGTGMLADALRTTDAAPVPVFESLQWTSSSGAATELRFAGTRRGSDVTGTLRFLAPPRGTFDVVAAVGYDGSITGRLQARGADVATFTGNLGMAGGGTYTVTASDPTTLPTDVGTGGTWTRSGAGARADSAGKRDVAGAHRDVAASATR